MSAPARGPLSEGLLRLVAAGTLAALGLGLAAPIAIAFEPGAGGCCRRGRCCCPAAPAGGGPCVRAACRCGGDREAAPAPALEDGLLPAPVAIPGDGGADDLAAPAGSARPVPDLVPPDRPPPSSPLAS